MILFYKGQIRTRKWLTEMKEFITKLSQECKIFRNVSEINICLLIFFSRLYEASVYSPLLPQTMMSEENIQ